MIDHRNEYKPVGSVPVRSVPKDTLFAFQEHKAEATIGAFKYSLSVNLDGSMVIDEQEGSQYIVHARDLVEWFHHDFLKR